MMIRNYLVDEAKSDKICYYFSQKENDSIILEDSCYGVSKCAEVNLNRISFVKKSRPILGSSENEMGFSVPKWISEALDSIEGEYVSLEGCRKLGKNFSISLSEEVIAERDKYR